MTYTSLLIHTVTIFNPEVGPSASEDASRYGDEDLDWDLGTASAARVQQTGAMELITGRDTRVTSYNVFLPAGAPVSALSIIEWESRQFRVVGEPAVRDGRWGPHHVELQMEEVAG